MSCCCLHPTLRLSGVVLQMMEKLGGEQTQPRTPSRRPVLASCGRRAREAQVLRHHRGPFMDFKSLTSFSSCGAKLS